MKSNVGTQINALNQEADKFGARWNQLKPKSDTFDADRNTMIKAVEFIKEKRQEFNELDQQRVKLL